MHTINLLMCNDVLLLIRVNIMELKVADFGLSREEKVDKQAAIRGTFGYLDPEYISSGTFTKKSDVYSYGVLLFELIAGRNPQQGLMELVELVRPLSIYICVHVDCICKGTNNGRC